MKKSSLLYLLLYFCFVFIAGITKVSAQGHPNRANLENLKIAYITQQVRFTPEQAEKFWPLYNQFSEKRQSIKKEIRASRNRIEAENTNNEVVVQMLMAIQNYKKEEIDLENYYIPKFLKVISPQQVALLARAERDFLAKMVKRLPESAVTRE